MAIYAPASNSNGDSDTAATWVTVNNPYTPISTQSSDLTSSTKGITVFTAPNTSNFSTGVIFGTQNYQGGATSRFDAELQEFNGSTWVTVASGTTDFDADGTPPSRAWYRIDWTTHYQYTTTSTGYYRIRIWGDGGYLRLYRQSGGSGTEVWTMPVDDRTGVPASGDQVYAVGQYENPKSFKLVGTQTIGNAGVDNDSDSPYLNYVSACILGWYCTLNIDTASDVSTTWNGMFMHEFGDIVYGSEGSQPTNNVTWTFNTDGTNLKWGYHHNGGGLINLWGNSEKLEGMAYDSGDGSTGDPVVVDSTWEVGDKLTFMSGTDYNDREVKYIKTKPSSTTATLSDTDGGAESALSNTYDSTGVILNFTRQFVIQSDGNNLDFVCEGSDVVLPNNLSHIRGVEFLNLGSSGIGQGFNWGTAGGDCINVIFSYCTFYQPSAYNRSKQRFEMQHCVGYGNSPFQMVGGQGHRYTDCWVGGLTGYAINLSGAKNVVSGCEIRCSNVSNSSNGGGISPGGTQDNTIRNTTIRSTRRRDIYMNSTATGLEVYNSTLAGEATSIEVATNVFVLAYFESCTLSAPTKIDNLSNATTGSEIVFDRYDDTANDHRNYQPYGTRTTTGASLSDTVTRTAGNISLKYEPTTTDDGIFEEFEILSNANSTATVNFYARRSSGLTTAKFELFLRGSDTPDDVVEWDNTVTADEWRVVSLAADWANSIPRYATVRITALGTTGSLRIADIFNGENDITGLNTYLRGKFGPVMFPQIADVGAISAAVWADSETYSSGQKGKVLQDTQSNSDATQAKIDQL